MNRISCIYKKGIRVIKRQNQNVKGGKFDIQRNVYQAKI